MISTLWDGITLSFSFLETIMIRFFDLGLSAVGTSYYTVRISTINQALVAVCSLVDVNFSRRKAEHS